MGRSEFFVAVRPILFLALLVSAFLRSDAAVSSPPSLPVGAAAEPITGTAVRPARGSETVRHDPFTPYDTGPGTWQYRDLKPAERQVVDRGREMMQWGRINRAFAAVAAERAHKASATAAAAQLGLPDIESIGVVR